MPEGTCASKGENSSRCHGSLQTPLMDRLQVLLESTDPGLSVYTNRKFTGLGTYYTVDSCVWQSMEPTRNKLGNLELTKQSRNIDCHDKNNYSSVVCIQVPYTCGTGSRHKVFKMKNEESLRACRHTHCSA